MRTAAIVPRAGRVTTTSACTATFGRPSAFITASTQEPLRAGQTRDCVPEPDTCAVHTSLDSGAGTGAEFSPVGPEPPTPHSFTTMCGTPRRYRAVRAV